MDNQFNGFFSSVNFSGGHEQDIVGVLNGQFDAAVTWSSMVGDASKGTVQVHYFATWTMMQS